MQIMTAQLRLIVYVYNYRMETRKNTFVHFFYEIFLNFCSIFLLSYTSNNQMIVMINFILYIKIVIIVFPFFCLINIIYVLNFTYFIISMLFYVIHIFFRIVFNTIYAYFLKDTSMVKMRLKRVKKVSVF